MLADGGEGSYACSNAKLKAVGWTPGRTSGEAFAATARAMRAGERGR